MSVSTGRRVIWPSIPINQVRLNAGFLPEVGNGPLTLGCDPKISASMVATSSWRASSGWWSGWGN